MHDNLNRILDDSIKDKQTILVILEREEKIVQHYSTCVSELYNLVGEKAEEIIEKCHHLIIEEIVKANIRLKRIKNEHNVRND